MFSELVTVLNGSLVHAAVEYVFIFFINDAMPYGPAYNLYRLLEGGKGI